MTPEEINRRIATWAGLDSHVCDEWSFNLAHIFRAPTQLQPSKFMQLLGAGGRLMESKPIKTNGKYCSFACSGRVNGPTYDRCRFFGGPS